MCVGTREVVDHQRLSGYGYCFSASLPPFLATAACVALEELQEASATREALCANARSLHEQLSRVAGVSLHAWGWEKLRRSCWWTIQSVQASCVRS